MSATPRHSPKKMASATDFSSDSEPESDDDTKEGSFWPSTDPTLDGSAPRSTKHRIYLLFDDQSEFPTRSSVLVSYAILVLINLSCFFFVLETVPAWRHNVFLEAAEVFFVACFSLEYFCKVPLSSSSSSLSSPSPSSSSSVFSACLQPTLSPTFQSCSQCVRCLTQRV